MTFTYDPAALGTDSADERRNVVRFLVADTADAGHMLEDEEITFLLAQNNDEVYGAAVAACEHLIAEFARKATMRDIGGELRLEYREKVTELGVLRTRLSEQAARRGVPKPWVGGLSIDERDEDEEDTDLVQPRFRRSMFDDPRHPPIDGGTSRLHDERYW